MSEQREQRREVHAMQQSIHILAATVTAALPHIERHPASRSMPPPAAPLPWGQACVHSTMSLTSVQRNVPVPIDLTTQHAQLRRPSAIPNTLPADTQPVPPPPISAPLRLTSHSVTIGCQQIHYDQDQLVAPPRRDYAAHPEYLSHDWEHLQVLLCPGQCEDIGVKYWKQVYKGTVHWKRLRKYYSIWQVRVHIECTLPAAECLVLMPFISSLK